MLALLLFVVLVCVIVGIVGFVVHGLIWLFIIAVVVFLGTLLFGGNRFKAGRAKR